ncbi:MAG: TRAP transporter TatT component family protein [Deltaproteobacteria bacterium]|nr:TRAP transporter TatT component family protein [Deltaproteobacteria bacterium]
MGLRIFTCSIMIPTLMLTLSCSVNKIAVNSLANALSKGGINAFAMDEDPELIGEAMPTTLKVMELLIQSAPDNQAILVAAASGFVQYSHAYVLRQAEALDSVDLASARKGRKRAKRLFLRARNYGLKALEVAYPGFSVSLALDPVKALEQINKADVPALYWTGAAWGSAISVSKDDMALLGDIGIVRAMMQKALSLDESWSNGAIHEFFILFSTASPDADANSIEQAQDHFNRAMELNGGKSISPVVSLAESVCVIQQDRERFVVMLNDALDFNVDTWAEYRLSNILAQRKASYLLRKIDDLFF